MINKIAAILTAAACAAFLVGLVPDFAPDASAAPSQRDQTATPDISSAGVRESGREHENVCAQSWPYYERSCLRDDRQADGQVGVVRVVAIDRSAAGRRVQARH